MGFSFGPERTPNHGDVRCDMSGRRHGSLGVFETSYDAETTDRFFLTSESESPRFLSIAGTLTASESHDGLISKTFRVPPKRRNPVEIRSGSRTVTGTGKVKRSGPGNRRQTESQGSLGVSGRRTRTF